MGRRRHHARRRKNAVTLMLHGHVVEDSFGFGRVREARQRHVARRVLSDEPSRPPHRVQMLRVLAHCLLQAVVNQSSSLVGLVFGLGKDSVSGVAFVGRVEQQSTRAAVKCVVVESRWTRYIVDVQHQW